jgi:hypothetical protein
VTKALLDYSQPPVDNAAVLTLDPGPTGEQSTDYVPTLGMQPGTMIPKGPAPGVRVVNLLHYRRIGHTLAAIVFGVAGAALGRLFAARRSADDGPLANRES